MPRKKKGLKFELLPRPTKDENGKPLLYARPAIRRKWSMKWLDDFWASWSTPSTRSSTQQSSTWQTARA